jgi:3-hydroxyacyl-[acyl-carrier-protein] dehydratase
MEISHEEILTLLPHRYPFLLVDRVLDWVANEKIIGLKNVTFNEPFFPGHFPGKPVMPGVLIIFFMGVDKVKFRKPVVPGDQMILELTALRSGQRVWKMQGKALVKDALVAEAELTAAIADEKENTVLEEA